MNDWIPSLNALRAFETVTRHLSYSAAADELRVTPSAVKHLITKLEDTLDLKLVARRGHRLELTLVGEAAKNDLSLGMRHITESVQKMRSFHTRESLIVSVETSLATTWLAPRLNAFLTENPKIDVLIDSSQKVYDLKQSNVDIAIRYGVNRDERLISNRLFEDLIFPACSPSIAEGTPEIEKLEQLRNMPLIHWDTSHMSWAHATRQLFSWDGWLRSVGIDNVDTSKGKRFSDYGLAVQAAVSGQGFILAGWPTLMDTIQAGLLVCPFEDSIAETDLGFDLVTTVEAMRRPEVSAFCNWLLDIASSVPSFR